MWFKTFIYRGTDCSWEENVLYILLLFVVMWGHAPRQCLAVIYELQMTQGRI